MRDFMQETALIHPGLLGQVTNKFKLFFSWGAPPPTPPKKSAATAASGTGQKTSLNFNLFVCSYTFVFKSSPL